MWMRSYAMCKALLRKLRLTDSIHCQCGWEWQGHSICSARLRLAGEQTTRRTDLAKVIEFYVPAKFLQRVKWLPPQQRGRVIEFCPPTKKSA